MYERFTVRQTVCRILGVLVAIGLLWAFLLVFWPLKLDMGAEDRSCGVPAVNAHDPRGYYGAQPFNNCAVAEALRMHKAVGVGAVTLPLTVLWLWTALGLRTDIAEAEQSETRRLDREADARRRSAAGGRTGAAPASTGRKMSLRELAAEADALPKTDG